MPILEVKNLTKQFDGVKAVNQLSLTLVAGAITALIGPNGSGKTTLVNLLSGLLPFDEGTIVIGDTTLQKIVPAEIAQLGLTRTFQEVRLFGQMSVLDNLLLVLSERNVWSAMLERPSTHQLAEAESILKQVQLWPKRNALTGDLSYGQRKLLEIGRALAMKAQIYLFDEPFAGLFPEIIERIVAILKELRDQNKAVVLIEHNMDLIRRLADTVIVLDSGELLAAGKPDRVLSQKQVIEAYLGE